MLLSTPEQIEKNHNLGLWGDERLDQRFQSRASTMPDELALIDDQGLHAVTGRKPQCLSYERAWTRVIALSGFLEGIGVKPDTVIAMLMPPCADAAVMSLAASRMGYILAPIPLTSGETEIREKLEQVGAKAIVCCARYEDEPVAERARNVAADMFSIRFVFCVGDGAPEGLIELQQMLDDEDSVEESALAEDKKLPSADTVIAIHWSTSGTQAALPIGRNHNELLCAARHVHEATGLEAGDCIMVAHHLSGLSGFAAGMVAAIDHGARVVFHHFRTTQMMADAIAEFGIQHVIVPGGQWQTFHDRLSMSARELLKSVSLVWARSHIQEIDFRDNETAARLLDLTNFCELALYCQIRRHPGEVGSIPLGSIAARGNPDVVLMETHLFGLDEARARGDEGVLGGELCIKGSMLPTSAFPIAGAVEGEALRAAPNGFIHTEVACHLVTEEHGDERAMFRPLGDVADILAFGGLTERGADLDALYKSCAGVIDAAAFIIPPVGAGLGQLMAALVVDDKVDAKERFIASLSEKRVAITKWPKDIILVEAIPRNVDGDVQRDSLLEASEISQVA